MLAAYRRALGELHGKPGDVAKEPDGGAKRRPPPKVAKLQEAPPAHEELRAGEPTKLWVVWICKCPWLV